MSKQQKQSTDQPRLASPFVLKIETAVRDAYRKLPIEDRKRLVKSLRDQINDTVSRSEQSRL